ncbi:MAG: hybrid sensor histidine kinase/response regulator [Opitutus sp.]|nr:hybrid sensor histidine kinase/response regulator [Opitutus sp.]
MSVVISETLAGARALPPPENLLGAWAASAALVYCRDWEGRVLAGNQSFARKFGCAIHDLAGRPVAALLHQDDMPALVAANAELAREPFRTSCETRWLTPQGWRWIAWEETAVSDGRGGWLGVRSVGHDITRQRVTEEQYFKLSRAVEQSPVAMVITDAEGSPQYVNAKFTEATGYTLEQLLDDGVEVLREGHPSEKSFQDFWTAVQEGREWRGELARDRPDGKKVWESVQVSCMRNPAGEITHLLCLREDITSRKTLEDQLRQAQKMESLGTLAGGIAHDFNNIIAVINGYAEFALLNPGDAALLQKCMREIKKASQRASGLVRQILTFSRKAEVRFAPLDLNQLTRELVALLAETFPRNLIFNFVLEENLPPLLADQNQLQQVILNLCVNARDAMPSGGSLTIATTRVEGSAVPAAVVGGRACACLAVTDTGTGMPPEVRARIFEPFYTTKAVNKGTGLGLAVVYGIVASHEGTIEVESEPGVGSTFKVYLPLADSAVSPPTVMRAGDFPGGTEALLIVDDEAPLRLLLEAALTRKGYKVASAQDGLEAIERIANPDMPLDAVLLDLNMPGANGIEVFRVIKATRPSAKVLVLTGHLTPEARGEFERMGQNHFVKKPYTLDELGRALRAVLEGAAAEK